MTFRSYLCISFLSYNLISSPDIDAEVLKRLNDPTDLSTVPEDLEAEPQDAVDQSTILTGIVGTSRYEDTSEARFYAMPVNPVSLSKLKQLYEKKDKKAVDLLSGRHTVSIDDDLRIPLGTGRVNMNTDVTKIDYHLTVANGIGFSSILPNVRSDHRFSLDLNLKRATFAFKGKHAMLGFDPTGSMLFIGQCHGEDVFLAMAPNEFLRGHVGPFPPGRSSGSSVMSKRHYRQMVMMFAHFLAQIPNLSFQVYGEVYQQDLNSETANFSMRTNAL